MTLNINNREFHIKFTFILFLCLCIVSCKEEELPDWLLPTNDAGDMNLKWVMKVSETEQYAWILQSKKVGTAELYSLKNGELEMTKYSYSYDKETQEVNFYSMNNPSLGKYILDVKAETFTMKPGTSGYLPNGTFVAAQNGEADFGNLSTYTAKVPTWLYGRWRAVDSYAKDTFNFFEDGTVEYCPNDHASSVITYNCKFNPEQNTILIDQNRKGESKYYLISIASDNAVQWGRYALKRDGGTNLPDVLSRFYMTSDIVQEGYLFMQDGGLKYIQFDQNSGALYVERCSYSYDKERKYVEIEHVDGGTLRFSVFDDYIDCQFEKYYYRKDLYKNIEPYVGTYKYVYKGGEVRRISLTIDHDIHITTVDKDGNSLQDINGDFVYHSSLLYANLILGDKQLTISLGDGYIMMNGTKYTKE